MSQRFGRVATLAALTIATIGVAVPAFAQDFPNRRVTLISPYPAGSGDAVGRVVAEPLAAKWKQQVIVEARPGASGLLGTRAVKNAPADGYTMLIGNPNFYGAWQSHKDPGYTPADFVPIAVLITTPTVLVVSNTIPHGSLKEVLDHAKANPGKLSYGSVGPLSFQQIFFERLKAKAGIDVKEVPFKGAVEAAQAVWTNTVQLATGSVGLTQTLIQQPTLKPIAVTSPQRSPYFPDLPTFVELGYPEFVEETPIMVLVSAETPAPIVAKLRADFAEALKAPEVLERYKKMSFLPYDRGLEQFGKETKTMENNFATAMKNMGYKPE